MNIKNAYKVVIPKKFNVGNYKIYLKRQVVGHIFKYDNGKCKYIEDSNKIIIDVDTSYGVNVDNFIENMKLKILRTYVDYKSSCMLSEIDNNILDLIEYVNDVRFKRPKALFIGYKFDYPNTIKNTLEQYVDCNSVILDKNIELYDPNISNIDNNFEPIYTMLVEKINKCKYDIFIIDIPNLTLNTKYHNTKKLLQYLNSKEKKILVLASGSIDKFKNIFGEYYSVIDKNYIVRCGNHEVTKNILNSILY